MLFPRSFYNLYMTTIGNLKKEEKVMTTVFVILTALIWIMAIHKMRKVLTKKN